MSNNHSITPSSSILSAGARFRKAMSEDSDNMLPKIRKLEAEISKEIKKA
jgi:hypothetical protein